MPPGGRGSTLKADPVEVELLKLRVAARLETVDFYFKTSQNFDKLVREQNRTFLHTLRTVGDLNNAHQKACEKLGKDREDHIHKMRARSLSAGRERASKRIGALDAYTRANREALEGKEMSAQEKAVVTRERSAMQPVIPSYREVWRGRKQLSSYRDPVLSVSTLRPYSAPPAGRGHQTR